MEGKSPEFIKSQTEKTDAGFSEKRAARIIEGKQTDNPQIKKRKPIRLLPRVTLPLITARREKILFAYKTLAIQIANLLEQASHLPQESIRQQEHILEEVKTKRHIQEELITALVLEVKGQLTENTISKEAWDLIQWGH